MCFNCPDYVDMCSMDGCHNPDGGPFGKYAKFYVGDTYCEHLAKVHGHLVALWGDRYGVDE